MTRFKMFFGFPGVMKEICEEVTRLLNKIRDEDKLVIAEGVNDKRALGEFGIKRVKTLKRRAMYKVIEEIKDKEVVILTDLDEEGKKLYGLLKHEFSQRGIRVDDRLREFLFKKTKLRQIEGLRKYWERIS